jgi:methyl-accepting chemotaxis protein
MFNRLTLSTKMLIVGVSGVLAFTVVLTWVYFRMEDRIYQDKRSTLTSVVGIAWTLVTEYEARIRSGELTPEEGRKRAALRVKSLRYNGQEYFWLNDMEPRMVMHPFKPELDGRPLTRPGSAFSWRWSKSAKRRGKGS